ncbi:YheU family protein [Thalassotalea psychrophila]|uniref:YheU family protein n=1 Tax=Thalassotalea psychrophila TaxID=3065647 RepID=A0ABY9TSV6_9GAMM|nr:YheU family protein [Colwelliaceae bacterium SQ149]
MIIEIDQISSEALNAIIENYILREGTDYGESECSMADKKQQITAQLKSKKIVLVYSELHETVNILPFEQFTSHE